MTTPYLDTSALAKWYLNEDFSDDVEAYLRGLSSARISSLTRVELRCLLGRRRRHGEISPELEIEVHGRFLQDVREGSLQVLPLDDEHAAAAIEIMEILPGHALRTLDALHLAVVRTAGIETVATADRVMAAAAGALGLSVRGFLPPERPEA